MNTGTDLVERIDKIMKERNLQRKDLCADLKIPTSTIATWKTRGLLPSVDVVFQIAEYLHVSVQWLFTGELSEGYNKANTANNPLSPISIINRLDIVLRQNNNDFIYDSIQLHETYLKDIVSSDTLANWCNGRLYPDLETLSKLAVKIKVNLQWLLTGEELFKEQYNQTAMELSKKYQSILFSYDCMNDDDRKIVSDLIIRLFKLQRMEYSESQKNTSSQNE